MSTAPGAGRTPRYGMVVDLNRCVGCQTCTIACKHHNDTPPEVQWRRVLDVELGEYPDVERVFLVTGCQHCANPPCVPVCPTGATRQRDDGLVTMDYDTCIGCGYCAVACPYQARTIAHEREWYYGAPTRQESQVFHAERVGVATKCTFCVDKIDEADESGAVPGLDLEHTPACAASCIAQALHFGDFADPDSNVSRLAAANESFQMHAELGTDPQIRYLYEVPESTPGRAGEERGERKGATAAEGSDPASPLSGARQTFWDHRAAMNFILGGVSSGLAVMAYLLVQAGWVPGGVLPAAFVLAAGGMAAGLLFVFAEIGRKARFLYVLRRPQSSWMTRETYAVALFYPCVAAALVWPSPTLHALVALAAAAFLFCQGRILHAGKGIPTWRLDVVPWMLIVSGLLEGLGVLILLAGASGLLAGFIAGSAPVGSIAGPSVSLGYGLGLSEAGATGLAVAGGVLTLANAILWHTYRGKAEEAGVGQPSLQALDAISGRMRWIGHLAQLLLFAAATLPFPEAKLAVPAAGVLVIVGGALWKFTLVTRACHQQGFALPRVPQRGSGARAAPTRLGVA